MHFYVIVYKMAFTVPKYKLDFFMIFFEFKIDPQIHY